MGNDACWVWCNRFWYAPQTSHDFAAGCLRKVKWGARWSPARNGRAFSMWFRCFIALEIRMEHKQARGASDACDLFAPVRGQVLTSQKGWDGERIGFSGRYGRNGTALARTLARLPAGCRISRRHGNRLGDPLWPGRNDILGCLLSSAGTWQTRDHCTAYVCARWIFSSLDELPWPSGDRRNW